MVCAIRARPERDKHPRRPNRNGSEAGISAREFVVHEERLGDRPQIGEPCRLDQWFSERIRFKRVVLPEPRKPVKTVTGTGSWLVIRLSPSLLSRKTGFGEARPDTLRPGESFIQWPVEGLDAGPQEHSRGASLVRHLDIKKTRNQDVHMRTTLTLEPDVAQLLREVMERENASLKDVINDALRRGLRSSGPRPLLRVEPHFSPLQPGIDPRGFNQLADEIEDEAVLTGMRKVE